MHLNEVPVDQNRRGLSYSLNLVEAARTIDAVISGLNPRGSSETIFSISLFEIPPAAVSVSRRSMCGGDIRSYPHS